MSTTSKLDVRSILRSKNHIGKDALKFQFEISLTRIHGLASGQFAFKWTRGTKVVYSNVISIEGEPKHGFEVNQKLSLVCTLFRSRARASSNSFDAKDSKLSIISMKEGKVTGTTLAKIHFNLAEYAGVSYTETRQSFNFNDRYTVEAVVTATFLKMHNDTNTPLGSEISGLTCNSSELGPDNLLFEYNTMKEQTSPVMVEGKNVLGSRGDIINDIGPNRNAIRAGNSLPLKMNEDLHLNKEQTSSRLSSIHMKSKKNKKGSVRTPNDWSTDSDRSPVSLESENSSIKRELSRVQQVLEAEANQTEEIDEDHSKLDKMAPNSCNGASILRKNHSQQPWFGHEKSNVRCSIFDRNKGQGQRGQEKLIASLRDQLESSEKARFAAEEARTQAIEERNCMITAQEKECDSNSSETFSHVAENELKQIEETLRCQEKKYQEQIRKSEELDGQVKSITGDNEKLEREIEEYGLHVANVNKAYDELLVMYAKLREEYITLQEQINMPQEEINRIETDSSNSKLQMKGNEIQDEYGCKSIMEKELTSEEQIEIDNLRAEVFELKHEISCLQQVKTKLESENSSFLDQIAAFQSERKETKQEITVISQNHEKLKKKYRKLVEKSAAWKKYRIENQASDVRREAENLDNNRKHKEEECDISSEDNILLDEIENMIETIQYEMQSALRLDKNSELALYNMSSMIEYLAPRMRAVVEQELTRQSSININLEVYSRQVTDLETCVFVQKEKEKEYEAQVKELQRMYKGLEKKSRKEWVGHEVEMLTIQKRLELKISELEAATTRIESIENELREKEKVANDYGQKIECLEEERRILESQAARELNLARNACKPAEEQYLDEQCLMKKYQNEVENLHIVVKNLEQELEKSQELVRIENSKALIRATENKNLREEARIQERKSEENAASQQNIIDSLESSINSIVQLWDKEIQEDFQDKRVVHGTTAGIEREGESATAINDSLMQKEEEVLVLKNRISELTKTIEEYSHVIKGKSEHEKELITEIEGLRAAISKEEFSSVRNRESYEAQLNDLISKTLTAEEKWLQSVTEQEELAEQNSSLEEKLSEISQTMSSREEEWSLVSTENVKLESNVTQLAGDIIQLNEELETLRKELAKSQEKLHAIRCSSAADVSRTRTELEEIKVREEAYHQELETKRNIILELQSKLVDISSKDAAERITANIQLIESRSREKSYQMEIERQRETVRTLVARLKESSRSSSFNSRTHEVRRKPSNSNYSPKMLLTS